MTLYQPVTFYIGQSAGEPVDIDVQHSGLRMVLVNRESVGRLGPEWRVLGVYFLIGPSGSDPERFAAYVGEVGRRDLLTRIVEHARQKDWWNRALLIRSVADDGFNSAEIGWLEGRLFDVINNAVLADVRNKGRPGDDSIPLKTRGILEKYVDPVIAALRACGASPDTVDQKPAPKGKKRAHYRQSVKDLIDAGLLKSGTHLQPTRAKYTETAQVLPDGSLQVAGHVYSAVSTAAVAVSGSKSEPGWEFWGAPSGGGTFVPLIKLRERLIGDASGVGPAPDAATAPSSSPVLASTSAKKTRYSVSVAALIEAGLVEAGETLCTTRAKGGPIATVTSDGGIRVGDQTYKSLSAAAVAASGNTAEPGWEYWGIERAGKLVSLYLVRKQFLETNVK